MFWLNYPFMTHKRKTGDQTQVDTEQLRVLTPFLICDQENLA